MRGLVALLDSDDPGAVEEALRALANLARDDGALRAPAQRAGGWLPASCPPTCLRAAAIRVAVVEAGGMEAACALLLGVPEPVEAQAAAVLRNITHENPGHSHALLALLGADEGAEIVAALSSRHEDLLVQVTGMLWTLARCCVWHAPRRARTHCAVRFSLPASHRAHGMPGAAAEVGRLLRAWGIIDLLRPLQLSSSHKVRRNAAGVMRALDGGAIIGQ